MKLRYITNILPLCPFVIRMEIFNAFVAVTLGLLARMYGVMEYASPFMMVGIKSETIPTKLQRYIHNIIHNIPPSLRPKLNFSAEYGSVAVIC